ncbi:methylenetetrahydrofolate reductase [bacterium]|nr:methylenetetrahydrofolate reductase [bacterium]RQV94739.1 MAG: methylenetetrahydrofolate reductase [bacterium]
MTLKDKIESKQFIICGELGPPQSCNGDVIRKKTAHFKGYVDAVNITDNQTAIVRLSSIASAKILLEEDIEPIIQMTCRDRNRIAIQSDLLGAAALGIENVLCLTGDHQKFGNHPESKGVFDLDSIQLVATLAKMNKGFLLSGDEMKTKPHFTIGAAANPFAEPFEMRLIRLYKKVMAGAYFIQTQPVFDLEIFQRWMEKVREMGLHEKVTILAGVMPVKSVKALLHMLEEVPGVKIDKQYINRMEQAADPQEEGIKIAVEMINALKSVEGVRGIHFMPVMWESITPVILKEAGLCK